MQAVRVSIGSRSYLCLTTSRSLVTTQIRNSELPVETPKDRADKVAAFKGKKFPDFESTYRKRGTGGRSSFNGITATIFNGSSFVAKSLIARLGKSGTQLVVAHRADGYNESKLRIAADLGQMYFSHYSLKDEKSLYEAMRYSNVVINLIGKKTETKNFSFDEVHVEGPRKMARIAREAGVKKFIHISALNASPNPTPVCLKSGSRFLKSKYYGELAVREEIPDAIIFRPSDILGEQDDFLNHFTSRMRCRFTRSLSIWDYYDGVQKQPVWVKDLVSGIEQAIYNDAAYGKTYQAVGEARYDFYELIEYMRACAGKSQKLGQSRINNLRYDIIMRSAMRLAMLTSKSPFLSWERIERDSTSDYVDTNLPTLTDLGVELTPLETEIKTLSYYRPRELRTEIPYNSEQIIDEPRKLNLAT